MKSVESVVVTEDDNRNLTLPLSYAKQTVDSNITIRSPECSCVAGSSRL